MDIYFYFYFYFYFHVMITENHERTFNNKLNSPGRHFTLTFDLSP